MSYLVDSDWLIDALAGVPTALATLENLSADGLAVSVVAFGEILEGAYPFPDVDARLVTLRRFLSGFVVLPLDEPIMEVFAHNRASLRRRGTLIPDLDLLIASTAITHGLTLLTRNVRHFSRLPALRLYQSS